MAEQLAAAADVEPLIDLLHVVPDRMGAELQLVGDLPLRMSSQQEDEHLSLSGGKVEHLVGRWNVGPVSMEPVDLAEDHVRDDAVPRGKVGTTLPSV
jgi:hypothetical protein